MAQITLDEGLAWLKTLKMRHEELITLRNDNAHRERRFYGAAADKELIREPVYHVKVLDKAVPRVAREIRLLDQAMKATSARTVVEGYDQDDAVLGELAWHRSMRHHCSMRHHGEKPLSRAPRSSWEIPFPSLAT